MRELKNIVVIIFSIFLFTSCERKDKLIGTWERYGDEFAGMQVKVVKEENSFKAKIIHATDTNILYGFVLGDIKWKNIKKTSENKYEFESLAKSPTLFSDGFEPSYSLTYLEMISDNEVYTRKFSKGTESIGTEQKWKRITKN